VTEKSDSKEPIRVSEIDPKFKYELSGMHGDEKILRRSQRGIYKSDCPVARFSDTFRPRTVIHTTQLGLKVRVAESYQVSLQLAKDKIHHTKMVEAQALITIYPFCHTMFNPNEWRIERKFSETIGTPFLHYPQLHGLVMDTTPEELAFKKLRVEIFKMLQVIKGVN